MTVVTGFDIAGPGTGGITTGVILDTGGAVANVKAPEFGALGNNVADDTTAIQTAINDVAAEGGGVVFFPAGTYLISAQLNITTANVLLVGVGADSIIKTINNANVNSMVQISHAANCGILLLKLDGNGVNQSGGSGNGVDVYDSTDTLIREITVANSAGPSMFIEGEPNTVQRAKIINCVITGSFSRGIHVYNSSRCLIQGCTIRASVASFTTETILLYQSPLTRVIGNYLTDPANGLLGRNIVAQASNGCTIADNILENLKDDGITLQNSNLCTVSGNTVTGATGSVGPGIAVYLTSQYNTITGNTVTACLNGIMIDGGTGADTPSDCTISNNVAQANTNGGIVLDAAGTATYRRITIVGNVSQGNTTYGIRLQGRGDACNISGNDLNGNGTNYSDGTSPIATANVVQWNLGYNPFIAGIDRTGVRALNTDYVAGVYRRTVHATVTCAATIANAATAGYETTMGGTAFDFSNDVGNNAGLVDTANFQMTFEVDPGGTYAVNSAVGGTSTVTLVRWIEVDW
jgi:parallel beta-helix repeat protein